MSNNEIEAALQYMLELLSSQASDNLSSDHFQQQHDMAEATDSDESVQQLVESSKATDSDESATIPSEPFVGSHEERTQDPRSPHSSQQQVEDDEVTIDMKEMIQDCGDGTLLPECCIFRVPLMLYQLNEEAYTPKVVSVGPFHYGNECLKDMERHKQIMFKRFIHRAESSLNDLVRLVKHLEPKVRASYSETINLTKDQLVRLTLTDAGFIIQLFIMYSEQRELYNDAKLSLPNFRTYIFQDLVLLENQLPFFVIEELFNKAFPNHHSHRSFLKLTYGYFGKFSRQEPKSSTNVKINHFTDLLRLFYLQEKVSEEQQPSSLDQPESNILSYNPNELQEAKFSDDRGLLFSVDDVSGLQASSLDRLESNILSYNANALQEAGIKLKARKGKLLDLKFSGHVLEIPKIDVDDKTELVFRNMIALEQCLYPKDAHIVEYTLVLDWLIDTHKDVNLLVHKKIVRNLLGDANDVASLFNGLGKHVVLSVSDSKYIDICKRLNSYCENPWHKLNATLKRDYCRTPWQIVASIAATVLLLLTVVQTISSILQVGK